MATAGKVSLTSLERDEVVITTMTGDEWNNAWSFGTDQCEARINALLGRQDLRIMRFRKIQVGSSDIARFDPLDIHDPANPAERRRRQKVSSFLKRGGRITEA